MTNPFKTNSTVENINVLNLLNQQILLAKEEGNPADLDLLLITGFSIIHASGARQDRQSYLDAVPANAHRGRMADRPEVQIYGDCAVFTAL